jgi:hypothetical protein
MNGKQNRKLNFQTDQNMKTKKILFVAGTICFVVLLAMAVVAQDYIFELLSGGGGCVMAAFAGAPEEQTVQGVVGTVRPESKTDGFVRQEVNKPTFSQKLAKIFPSRFPMDTILREIGTGSTKSDIYKYPSVVARGVQAKVKTANTAVTAPDVATISMVSVHNLSLNGNLLVPNYTATGPDAAATKISSGVSPLPLVLHIVEIDRSAKTIKVYPLNASGVPAFEADTTFYRMGSAMDQEAARSSDPTVTPTYDYNYVQTNMCTISQLFAQEVQEKETEWGMADMKEMALFDFRYQNEMNALFGVKRELVDPISQKPKYMMDGIIRKVGNTLVREADQSVEKFLIHSVAKTFDANNGSDTRVMFYGSEFGIGLSESATFQKQLEAGKTKVKFGITWNEVETNSGRLLCKMHTGLALAGYGSAGLILDVANVRKVEQLALQTKDLDLDTAGERRSKDTRVLESFTMEVTNPDTHTLMFL